MNAAPPRPPLEGLRKQLEKSRTRKNRMPRDGFVRETFTLPRQAARKKRGNGSILSPRRPIGRKSKAGASGLTM